MTTLSISLSSDSVTNLATGSIISIAVVHVLGFLDLDWWFRITGIGPEALKVREEFGMTGYVLLNTSAILLFLALAGVHHYSVINSHHPIVLVISLCFVVRGALGLISVILGITGSTTLFLETIFSLIALIIGILCYLEVKTVE